jgi:hypothetical protein
MRCHVLVLRAFHRVGDHGGGICSENSHRGVYLLFSNEVPAILTTVFQEKVILDSPNIGPEYERYQKKVTARLLPCIW